MSMPSYEVRCANCDVSFPVGTKNCIHCGNRINPGLSITIGSGKGSGHGPGSTQNDPFASETTVADSEDRRPEPMDTDPFGTGGFGKGAREDSEAYGHEGDQREGEMDSGSGGLARTLARSLGGVIWIIALIAFSLARDCGN